ncbi:MAG: asparagine synthase (glutamine-hydrolyzing) [Gammaproteobacteria bacterium]
MCGIAGYVSFNRDESAETLETIATAQADAIVHRGPDSGDVFVDERMGVALAHRRLAIIDLSAAGYQPMQSADGSHIIVYNGEIYNADETREELQNRGIQFRGHSDTEVLLEACVMFGVENAIKRFVGMFAFAVLDRSTERLTLVRDRLGIKPLFYSFAGNHFIFGSELKALRAHPRAPTDLDYDGIAAYFRYQYIPTPHSVYRQVRKLPQGNILEIDLTRPNERPAPQPFWSFHDKAISGFRNPNTGTDSEVIDEFDDLLRDAVTRRMIADVPLGVFLSGGVDSSTVVALMQEASSAPVRTFSIGFDEGQYNEAKYAAEIAKHLGTNHTELYVSPQQALDVIPNLTDMYDEPYADSSQIPTFLVSEMTRKHVTVALSGDGGDELFAGYNRYPTAEQVANKITRIPMPLRKSLAAIWQAVPAHVWDMLFNIIPASRRPMYAGDKVHKFAQAFTYDADDFYKRLISIWNHPEEIAAQGTEAPTLLTASTLNEELPGLLERMQYWDTMMYMPDDILTKVDRASMAVSLEVRVPIIDHRVVEFAWTLPRHFKVRDGVSKWILREVLYRRVPRALIDRPKMGFAVPIDRWFRGPLKEWAGDLLSRESIVRYGLMKPEPVERIWQEHLSGNRNWAALLWNVIMLQSWCHKNLGANA